MGVLLLVGKSAWAVDANVWTKPVLPAITEFVPFQGVASTDEAEVYLYNVKAGLFFVAGNNWGTQASLIAAKDGDGNGAKGTQEVKGAKVWFLTKPDGTYEIKNFVEKHNGIRSAFSTADGLALWTDNDSEACRFWKVTPSGDGYLISNSTAATNKFLGWKGSIKDTRLYLIDASEDAAVIWKFVAPEVYEAWAEKEDTKNWLVNITLYEAAMELKKALDEAETLGVDVTEELAVYNNTQSTADQLTKAAASASKKNEDAALTAATVANPKSASSYIANPDFVKSPSDGWTAESGTDNFGANGGKENAELYNKGRFNVYQTVKGLPNGVYAVGVNAFYRAGNSVESYKHFVAKDEEMNYAKLYAVSGSDTLMTPLASPYEGAPTTDPGTGTWAQDEGKQFFIPNNMVAAEYAMHTLGMYSRKVIIGIDEGSMTIGVKKDKHLDADWAIFDDFSLTYYGNGADAYQMWLDNLKSSYVASFGEGTLYTESYMSALNAAIEGKTASTYAEVKAIIAAAQTAKTALDKNVALWKEWEGEVKEAQKTIQTYFDLDAEALFILMEYCDETEENNVASQIRAAHSLDNEALEAEIAKVKKLVEDVVEAAKSLVEVGQDMTTFITNPDFSEGQKGWTGWRTVWQVKWGDKNDPDRCQMPKVNESCAEAFSAPNFDLYQEVEGLPLGIYEVSVQGFFRFGRGNDAWTEWNKQGEERADYVMVEDPAKGSPVFFYVNEKATPFINVYQEGGRTGDSPLFDDLATVKEEQTPLKRYSDDDAKVEITTWEDASEIHAVEQCQRVDGNDGYLFFPDGMKSAHNYFNADAYKQTTFSAVAHKGDKLRIGVKGHSDVGVSDADSWAIFDNFKLVYRGKDKAVVKPVLEDAIIVAKAKQNLTIAKDVKEQLTAAIAAAEAAVANDADNMFEVLADLWGVDVSASQQKIQELKASLTPFENAINDADAADDDTRPLQSVLDEATSVRTTAQNYVDGAKEFTNADIDAIVAKMKELTEALKVPAAMSTASDDNPANATYLIKNPTYNDDSKDRTLPADWKQDGTDAGNYRANSGVYEVWNPHVDVLSYQDLEKMPAGTYELSVQGVYRYGWADNDYKAYTEDANNNNYGTLYLKVGEAEAIQKALPRLAALAEYFEAEAETDESGEYVLNDKNEYNYKVTDKWIWAQQTISDDKTMATGYIMPDQLGSTTPFFEDETVKTTSIIFRVGEEGKARIGVNIKHVADGDWVVWDNWTLKYYGANSAKDPDVVNGVKDASALADVVKTEVFNLSGAQVKNGKGVAIVRQTLSNGTVRVKKVIVK